LRKPDICSPLPQAFINLFLQKKERLVYTPPFSYGRKIDLFSFQQKNKGTTLKNMTFSPNLHYLNDTHTDLTSSSGAWTFNNIKNNLVSDLSGKGHPLMPHRKPKWEKDFAFGMVAALDGETQFLSTNNPVLKTDKNFSIIAWVRLNSSLVQDALGFKKGICAVSAVTQDSLTHSAFHLGVRLIKEPLKNGTITEALKWCFAVSPMQTSEEGGPECQFAYSTSNLDHTVLDKWVMVAGVQDVTKRTILLYIPSINEKKEICMPDNWSFWEAKGGLQIGRGQWQGEKVDFWPGSISSVRVFSDILKTQDIERIYRKEAPKCM
jgi:hypothetical protein